MEISAELLRHVASLARLELDSEEVEMFQGQLSSILTRAQRVQDLNLDDVAPTHHPQHLKNVLRTDEVVASPDSEPILSQAPEREGEFFRVPKILEEEA